ncbi:MAG: SRPBCC family protein [Acidobacteriota bacterium]|nr:SRPBCC family protein [Acidobacteriota bacterium]MDE3043612.1 SRPBCC family protein [Acidobacteriota bacterium]MDE3106958.1 SRPBCC family protein [Acidobacteriota bacterium]MDE3222664.1 SRPBCC family protein [Acidobacteriota bacterium]
MATYQFAATTKKDPLEVLNFFADMTNASGWDPSITAVERLDRGAISTDSAFRLTIQLGGRSLTLTYRVAVFDPGRRLVLRAKGWWYISEDTVTLLASGEGTTEVRYEARLSGRGPARLLEPLLQRAIQQLGEAAGSKLRATYFS